MPIPTEIRLHKQSRCLEVTFEDGISSRLSFGYLRAHSPAAGEHPQAADEVMITSIEPVGNYAIRLVFSDGHDSGLYTWETLYQLAVTDQAKQDSP